MRNLFDRAAQWTARQSGRPLSFAIALGVVVTWAITGPLFHYSDAWQLVINTGTTIVTFLMVFLIQNSQNRDTLAIQLKLDELIRATEGAKNKLMALEDQGEDQIEQVKQHFTALREAEDAQTEALRETGRAM